LGLFGTGRVGTLNIIWVLMKKLITLKYKKSTSSFAGIYMVGLSESVLPAENMITFIRLLKTFLLLCPGIGRRRIAISVSVCLFVGLYVFLSVCLSTRISEKHTSKFHHIFCTCYLRPCLGPPLKYVVYFQFCGRNPFHTMKPVGQTQARRYFSSSSPSCGTGAKSTVFDGILFYSAFNMV